MKYTSTAQTLLRGIVSACAAVCLLAGCAAIPRTEPRPSDADEEPHPERFDIRLNLVEGQSLELDTRNEQVLQGEVFGYELTVWNSMHTVLRFTVFDVDADGTIGFRVTYDTYDMEIAYDSPDIPTGELNTMSAGVMEIVNHAAELFREVSFVMWVSPYGGIESVDGFEVFSDILMREFGAEALDQQALESLSIFFDEANFMGSWSRTFGYLPDTPVAVGDRWDMGDFPAAYTGESTSYSLETVTDGEYVIGFESTIDGDAFLEGILGNIDTGGVETKLDMESATTGTMRIDRNTGWINESRSTVEAEAEFMLFNEGQEIEFVLRIQMESTIE